MDARSTPLGRDSGCVEFARPNGEADRLSIGIKLHLKMSNREMLAIRVLTK